MSAIAMSFAPVARPAVGASQPVKANKARAMVSNGSISRDSMFKVWQPVNNKYFETFSFLPPLTDDQISKQVEYMVANGFTPCLEFSEPDNAYISSVNAVRFGPVTSGYQDNRYWPMWKLPMFGCTDGQQVLKEVNACITAFPDAYVRLVAFDASRQVQIAGFLVHRPANAKEFCAPDKRSV